MQVNQFEADVLHASVFDQVALQAELFQFLQTAKARHFLDPITVQVESREDWQGQVRRIDHAVVREDQRLQAFQVIQVLHFDEAVVGEVQLFEVGHLA